jgi:aconitate hydratase
VELSTYQSNHEGELVDRIQSARTDGTDFIFKAIVRLDTPVDVNYYRNGGILQTVLRKMAQA